MRIANPQLVSRRRQKRIAARVDEMKNNLRNDDETDEQAKVDEKNAKQLVC